MGEGLVVDTTVTLLDVVTVQKELLSILLKVVPSCLDPSEIQLEGLSIDDKVKISGNKVVCEYVSEMAAHLVVYDTALTPVPEAYRQPDTAWRYALATTESAQWKDCILPYVVAFKSQRERASSVVSKETSEEVKEETEKFSDKISSSFRAAALGDVPDITGEDEADSASLCNIAFSLAFGGKILLHNTHLKLGKGRRYGLMGKNGAGKTTLLTNIGSGNIEGMPPHLRMVYVQHDDASEDFGVPLIDEIMAVSACICLSYLYACLSITLSVC
jgi:hypothetical protein